MEMDLKGYEFSTNISLSIFIIMFSISLHCLFHHHRSRTLQIPFLFWNSSLWKNIMEYWHVWPMVPLWHNILVSICYLFWWPDLLGSVHKALLSDHQQRSRSTTFYGSIWTGFYQKYSYYLPLYPSVWLWHIFHPMLSTFHLLKPFHLCLSYSTNRQTLLQLRL
jgi:hypothetical protein